MDTLNLPVNPLIPIPTDVVLTKNMIEILPDVVQGLSVHAIAKKMGVGPRGIARRITQIYLCFNVKDRFQLIHRAMTTGLHFKNLDDEQMCLALKLETSKSAVDARSKP